ncbi:MAG TPA: hypothetical protein VL688_09980 [Verrucomicrobiae bacterium]|jgi:hypothetical protein|nr:hypothetical protein [Verrucomicrobiae bacterium]
MKRPEVFALLCGIAVFFSAMRAPLAEPYQDPDRRFVIEVPEGWAPKIPQYEGVAASFSEYTSGASVNISVRDGAGMETEDLKWEDLFSPMYGSVNMRLQGFTEIDGARTKYCLYTLKGKFRKQMEGKTRMMYLNYVMVRNEQIYSVTFSGKEATFVQQQPVFFKMARSLNFPEPV